MDLLAAMVVVLACALGVALTLLTLPGTWLMIVVAAGCWWWRPELYERQTLVAAVGVALAAEVIELAFSALGAAKFGGSKRGAIGAILGALVGALGGSAILPIIGTIIGGALGAGGGALIAERHGGRRSWGESARVGTGAAIGRLVATLVKTALALVVASILCVGAFVQ